MTIDESANPYESPQRSSSDAAAHSKHGVYRYVDLPRTCPSCQRKFSETFFHRMYRRKFRLRTLAFFAFLITLGLALWLFIGWLTLLVVIPLGAWAMRWHKSVTVHCPTCKWRETFVVPVRG